MIKVFFVSLFSFLLLSCSGTAQKEINLKFTSGLFESWVDLMPGGEPKFYYAGEISVENLSDQDFDFPSEIHCSIMQAGKAVFQNKCNVLLPEGSENRIITGNSTVNFILASESGHSYKEINIEEPVDLQFFYITDGFEFRLNVQKVPVNKVY